MSGRCDAPANTNGAVIPAACSWRTRASPASPVCSAPAAESAITTASAPDEARTEACDERIVPKRSTGPAC